MSRYSLVKINDSTKVETPIVIDGVLEEKNSLEKIDRFTSKFSKDELYTNLFVEENETLYIKYKYDSEYKYLPILTKEHETFLIFVKEDLNECEEREYQDSFDTYINRLLKVSEKYPQYLEYLSECHYITEHVSGRIHEYLRDDNKKVKAKISIEKNLGGYRQLRDWHFGTKAFISGDKRMNGKLDDTAYPTHVEELYHQCTVDETIKTLNLTK